MTYKIIGKNVLWNKEEYTVQGVAPAEKVDAGFGMAVLLIAQGQSMYVNAKGVQLLNHEDGKNMMKDTEQRLRELEAHVLTLSNALKHLSHKASTSGADLTLALISAANALDTSPAQSLAVIQAHAIESLSEIGLTATNGELSAFFHHFTELDRKRMTDYASALRTKADEL